MHKKNKPSVWWLVGFTVVAAAFIDLLHLNFLTATVLFFGGPSLYLTWLNPRLIKKALVFILGIFFGHPKAKTAVS